jgi:hypothetical protein
MLATSRLSIITTSLPNQSWERIKYVTAFSDRRHLSIESWPKRTVPKRLIKPFHRWDRYNVPERLGRKAARAGNFPDVQAPRITKGGYTLKRRSVEPSVNQP